MQRPVVVLAFWVLLLTPFVGEGADKNIADVSAEEYRQARQAWIQSHKELGRAVESANAAAVDIAKLMLSDPTCAQLERARVSPLKYALSRSRVTIALMKKLLGMEQRLDHMDEVRKLEVVMRAYHENVLQIHEVLALVVLKRAEVCDEGQEVIRQAPDRAPVSCM